MAFRHLFFVTLLLFPACGGKEGADSSNPTTTGGGTSVAGGTGGSSGTTGTTGGRRWRQHRGAVRRRRAGPGWRRPDCLRRQRLLRSRSRRARVSGLRARAALGFTRHQQLRSRRASPRDCHLPNCPVLGPGEANAPNYYAACESGHCQPVDVRTSALSACTADTDCALRNGTTCCGCGGGNLIAVSKQANVEQTFCASGPCAADCTSSPLPPGVTAICTTGHCAVRYATSDGGVQ